jgi:hypothetical protein
MTLRCYVYALTLVAVVTPWASANTLRVPTQHATIQSALTAASAGDTVLVAPGTYTGAGNRDLDFHGQDMVLRSEAGAEVTIIDVAGTEEDPARGVLLGSGLTPAAVLEGFTIINGLMVNVREPTSQIASSARHELSGAGIMIRGFCSPTVRNCIIRNCFSEFTGGGVGVELGANPRLENVVVTGCSAGIQGGGISVETGGDAVLMDCTFTGNRSFNGGGGHFSPGAATLTGCLFAGNAADGRGGGIDVIFLSRVQLQRTIVWNNCGDDGDDIFVDPALAEPDAGFLRLSCSVVDTTKMSDTARVTEFIADNVFADPMFCGPVFCSDAPTSNGNYAVGSSSPALQQNSPCGAAIGPTAGSGCASPVRPGSWTNVKSLYRRR